jgi:hypothetical protein
MKNRFRVRTIALLLVALLLSLGLWGCSREQAVTPVTPEATSDLSLKAASENANFRAVMAIQDRFTPALMADPDVIGTATTIGDDGQPAVLLLVTSERARAGAPKTLDGVPVQFLMTDRIVAMKSTTTTVSHTAKQTPPIQMGTSGGWRYDLANGYCCAGTLGSLIQVGGNKRILSNYHVFEADIISGGNGQVSATGDYIIQPGLIDIGCVANNAQNVATLVATRALPSSNVDASTANIITGMVREDGAILEVGTISASTVAAFVNQPVKKSGRTTGLTRSKITGLNATISVAYENECAGGSAFTKTYTGQIVIGNKGSRFLAGGDSGSLMVEDVATNPRAVGLLFAGSSSTAIANPIGQVLSYFGATMVGN